MKLRPVILSLLVITMSVPLGFYEVHADVQENGTEDNGASPSENETQTDGEYNATGENIGTQVSDFVHNATAVFQQQRDETIQAIKDCREKMQNTTSDNGTKTRDECQATFTAIREKYQAMRNQFQELFKQFRESIITLRHDAEGLHVSDQDRKNAIKHIDDDATKNKTRGMAMAIEDLKGMGHAGFKNDLGQANETNENRGNPHGMQNQTAPPMDDGEGQHGRPAMPGEGGAHGKH